MACLGVEYLDKLVQWGFLVRMSDFPMFEDIDKLYDIMADNIPGLKLIKVHPSLHLRHGTAILWVTPDVHAKLLKRKKDESKDGK